MAIFVADVVPDTRPACRHSTLERIDDGYLQGDLVGGVYRCAACGGLALFPSQSVAGIRKILERAAQREEE